MKDLLLQCNCVGSTSIAGIFGQLMCAAIGSDRSVDKLLRVFSTSALLVLLVDLLVGSGLTSTNFDRIGRRIVETTSLLVF